MSKVNVIICDVDAQVCEKCGKIIARDPENKNCPDGCTKEK